MDESMKLRIRRAASIAVVAGAVSIGGAVASPIAGADTAKPASVLMKVTPSSADAGTFNNGCCNNSGCTCPPEKDPGFSEGRKLV